MSRNSKTLMSSILSMTLLLAGLSIAGSTFAKPGGGKGGGNAGGGNGGEDETVYSAEGDLINAPAVGYIDSTNLSFDDIIFRPSAGFTFNLNGFDVSGPESPCEDLSNSGQPTNFSDSMTGTLVLAPGDSAKPYSAELRFGFQGMLSDGSKTAQHYLVMNGTMNTDWPPTETNELMATRLEFTDWSIEAEKKNAQNNDCDGFGDIDPSDPLYHIYIWVSTP